MKPEQITAWALDEASAEERKQLEAALRENPESLQAAEETKDFCHFLLAELRDDSLALTEAQRERLKSIPAAGAQAGEPQKGEVPRAGSLLRQRRAGDSPSYLRDQDVRRPRIWRMSNGARVAIAACLAVGGYWVGHKVESRRGMQLAALPEPAGEPTFRINSSAQSVNGGWGGLMAPEHRMSGGAPPLSPQPVAGNQAATSSMPGAGAQGLPGMPGSLPGTPMPYASAPSPGGANSSAVGLNMNSGTMSDGDLAALKKVQDENAYGLQFAGTSAPVPNGAVPTAGNVSAGSADTMHKDLMIGGMLAQVDEGWESKVPMLSSTDSRYFGNSRAPNHREPEERGGMKKNSSLANEAYQRIVENELKDVPREPLSTFSIDVDTAAYANMRRFLNQGVIPPADAVRIEELINYFPATEEGPAPGAKEPFGVRVEMAPCPWEPEHRLARIAIKGRELGNERKASNLVFLVDVSGSMDEPSKLPLVQQSLRMLTEQLGEGDRVTMVVYAGNSGLVLPPTNGEKKNEIMSAIAMLKAGGGTHGSAGIQLAYEQAAAGFIKGGVNRVILCTDGDFNVGISSPEELEKLIKRKAKGGVFLSVLGFGTGNLKDRTMETLADKGNGNYAYIDSLSEARKVLVEQMNGTLVTIAKDVKIQVEFNPAAVRSYRLIGYENRIMAKEDFNDDTKDAGEIGAGHSVVALYEIVPANLPPGAEPRRVVDNLRYQTQAPAVMPPVRLADAARTGEVMTVKLRYKEPNSSLSKLIEMPAKDEGKTLTASTEEFKFSAAVAGFGLLLRDSQYKGSLGWETVRKLAIDGKGADKLGYRGEFLQLIDKAQGIKEGGMTKPE